MARTRFVKAGSFIDGSGGAGRRNIFLAIQDGIITAIGSVADLPDLDRAAVDDFPQCTILPPLVDCSVSLSQSPSVDCRVRSAAEEAGPAEKAAMVAKHIRYCHDHGVLGIAVSDRTGLVKQYEEESAQRSIIEIRSSGRRCRSQQDGTPAGPAGGVFLKIDYSASIDDEEAVSPLLSYQDLCRILQQRGGKKAVVAANGATQVAEALAAGCDAIEQGYAMGAANLQEMAAKKEIGRAHV